MSARSYKEICFASFHAGLRTGEEVHPNATLNHVTYMGMIETMMRSARMFYPHMQGIILSDPVTDFGLINFDCTKVVRSIRYEKLMLERMLMQLEFLQSDVFASPVVMLDSDILINRNFDEIFSQRFDVALTWRKSGVPINGGFLVFNNERPDKVRKFLAAVVHRYETAYIGEGGWFGDQHALRDVVGMTHHQMAKTPIANINGCRVLLLPCETYNHSPANRFSEITQRLETPAVLHFKGERKRLLQPYWEAHLAWREDASSSPDLRAQTTLAEIKALAVLELATPSEQFLHG